jgi:hypothetical protein
MSTIKAGDVVRFNLPIPGDDTTFNLTVGNRYVVTNVHDMSSDLMIMVVNDLGKEAEWLASRFTKVEREFRVGDVVEVVEACGEDLPLLKSRFKLHTPIPSPAPDVKWAVCPLTSDGNIEVGPFLIFSTDEKDAITSAKEMAIYRHGETFAAVSFTIASAYRAEPVETKTVKYEVRQVR